MMLDDSTRNVEQNILYCDRSLIEMQYAYEAPSVIKPTHDLVMEERPKITHLLLAI